MGVVTADLITRARAGDGDAFRALAEPHRRELQVHCYRMLGSFQDAEDVVQDTLLTAWQGLGGFEGRASIRTWLYRIATNRCLNALRSASRRPATEWNIAGVEPPEPTRLGERSERVAVPGPRPGDQVGCHHPHLASPLPRISSHVRPVMDTCRGANWAVSRRPVRRRRGVCITDGSDI